ncbi:MAG: hypothetical protein RIQ99_645, partial [Pseudomonadota bacterium]
SLLQLPGSAARAAWRDVVSLSADLAANTVRREGNAVVFGTVPPAGTVAVSGRLDASTATGQGGTISVAGQSVRLNAAQLDASGATGGTIAVGGGALGHGIAGMAAAQTTQIDTGSQLQASGNAGSGGTVTVWGGDRLDYAGTILATGRGGNGGSAEVSGQGAYAYRGTTNLLSEGGRTGTLLLDPGTIVLCHTGDIGCSGAASIAAIQGDSSTTSTAYLQDTTLASALSTAAVTLSASVQITDSAAVSVATAGGGALTLSAPNLTLSGAYGVKGGLVLDNTDATSRASGVISGTGALTKAGSGTLTLGAVNTYSGTTTVNAGTLRVLNASTTATTATLGTGNVAIGSGAVLEFSNSRTADNAYVINNVISGAGSLAFSGPDGSRTTLGGVNTFTGGTSIRSGIININQTGANGLTNVFGTGTITMTGGAISATNTTRNVSNALVLSGTIGSGMLTNLTGAITLAGDTTITPLHNFGSSTWSGPLALGNYTLSTSNSGPNVQGGSWAGVAMTISGAISGTGGITHNAPGTLVLTGANTYTGTTAINAGALNFSPATTATIGGVAVGGGATLNLTSGTTTLGGNLIIAGSGAGTVNLNSGAILVAPGIGKGGGTTATFNFNGGTLRASAANASFFEGLNTASLGTNGGTIDSNGFAIAMAQALTGTGALTKAGSGTLTLAGVNTYSGTTTVNAGTLTLNGAWNLGTGTATTVVASGAALGGSGTITAATLSHSGSGSVSLTGANAIAALRTTGTIGTFGLNAGQSLATGSITASGPIALTTTAGSGASLTLNANAVLASSSTNTAITLAADGAFINNSGSGALSAPNGRWLVYAAAPAGNTFGALNSGNRAVWATANGAAVSATGNRYVFAFQPTLTFTSTSASKQYGTDAASAIAGNFTVSGIQIGINDVYLDDTAAVAYAGNPLITSAGSAASASVAGGPYAITVGAGTATALNGYALSYTSAGSLTITPAPLTLTGAARSVVYNGTAQANTYAITAGQLFGSDAITGITGLASAANAGTYADALTAATGSGLGNYAIRYVNGSLTITPAPLTLTYTANSAASTYGSAFAKVSGTVAGAGFVGGEGLANLLGQVTWSADPRIAAGQYPISGSGLVSSNYAITARQADSNAFAYQVNPAPLQIKVNDYAIAYSGSGWMGGNGLSIAGFVNGDTTSALHGTLIWGGPAQGAVAVGSYELGASGLSNPNYAITWTPGTLTITPPPPSEIVQPWIPQAETLKKDPTPARVCGQASLQSEWTASTCNGGG